MLATVSSVLVHCSILYVPFLVRPARQACGGESAASVGVSQRFQASFCALLQSQIFGVVPLTVADWLVVLAWSLPVIFIDELLKFIGRLACKGDRPLLRRRVFRQASYLHSLSARRSAFLRFREAHAESRGGGVAAAQEVEVETFESVSKGAARGPDELVCCDSPNSFLTARRKGLWSQGFLRTLQGHVKNNQATTALPVGPGQAGVYEQPSTLECLWGTHWRIAARLNVCLQ